MVAETPWGTLVWAKSSPSACKIACEALCG